MSEQIQQSGPHHVGPMYRPSRDDDQGMDAGTVRLLCILGASGFVILVGVLIYSLTGHSPGGTVPVVQADQRPIRVKPENPGGMAVAPEEKQADPNDSRLAPSTEEPNPRALMAITGPARLPLPPALSPPHAKSISVQLQMTKSEAGAQAEWDKLAKQLPEVMGSHRPLFQKTNEPGPTPWRLRTSGFADPAQAKTFCDKVRAKGGQCTVIDS